MSLWIERGRVKGKRWWGIMGISGVLGGAAWGTSVFQRTNREIVQIGQRWAASISARDNSYANVSNFGNETHIGASRFAKGNDRIYNDGTRLTGRIASIGSSYSDVSKMGNGEFSHVTHRIFSDGSNGMKSAADGARAYVDTLNYRSQHGSSHFQKANEFVSLRYLKDA